jgi:hypothetical protein
MVGDPEATFFKINFRRAVIQAEPHGSLYTRRLIASNAPFASTRPLRKGRPWNHSRRVSRWPSSWAESWLLAAVSSKG